MRGGSSNVLVGNFWEVYLAAIILHRFGQRAAIGRWSACSLNDPKITFGETRAIGVSHILVDCVNCARYKAVSADRWPDDARLSGPRSPISFALLPAAPDLTSAIATKCCIYDGYRIGFVQPRQ